MFLWTWWCKTFNSFHTNKLLQKSYVKRYPPSSDACSLANAFADFFAQKIDKIHADLHEKRTADPDLSSYESTRCQAELSDFAVLSQDAVKEYACKSAKKSCTQLDMFTLFWRLKMYFPDCLGMGVDGLLIFTSRAVEAPLLSPSKNFVDLSLYLSKTIWTSKQSAVVMGQWCC